MSNTDNEALANRNRAVRRLESELETARLQVQVAEEARTI